MSILNTIHERKAAVETAVIMILLIISFFFLGMTYMDPPPEIGIELVMLDEGGSSNYGTSETGSGEIQPMTTDTPQSQSTSQSNSESSTPTLTQDHEDNPVIVNNPKVKPKKDNPKPDQSTLNAVNNISSAPSDTNQSSTSHGNTTGGGDQGNINGNPYANSYYGDGNGSGTGIGYGINGRNKTSNQKFTQECDEEGRVVVQIEVDRNGKVINAIPGVKGTTNSASCLLEPAKRTALSYRFNADSKAPTKQIGFVVVNFTLGQ